MFHLSDNALDPFELDLLEDIAHVEPDGLMWYDGANRKDKRAKYNAVEILLYWTIPAAYGVQRITVGVREPMSVARWRKRLKRNRYGDSVIAERQKHIEESFPTERVECLVVGWRVTNFQYWNPTGALKIRATSAPRVEASESRDSRHIHTVLAKRTNEEN